jgi:hypothetical protein
MIRRYQDYFRAKFQSFVKNHGRLDTTCPCFIICRENDSCALLWITSNSGRYSDKRSIPRHFTAYKKGIHINKKYNFLHGISLLGITFIMGQPQPSCKQISKTEILRLWPKIRDLLAGEEICGLVCKPLGKISRWTFCHFGDNELNYADFEGGFLG